MLATASADYCPYCDTQNGHTKTRLFAMAQCGYRMNGAVFLATRVCGPWEVARAVGAIWLLKHQFQAQLYHRPPASPFGTNQRKLDQGMCQLLFTILVAAAGSQFNVSNKSSVLALLPVGQGLADTSYCLPLF